MESASSLNVSAAALYSLPVRAYERSILTAWLALGSGLVPAAVMQNAPNQPGESDLQGQQLSLCLAVSLVVFTASSGKST
jgi:hypothetical protein